MLDSRDSSLTLRMTEEALRMTEEARRMTQEVRRMTKESQNDMTLFVILSVSEESLERLF